MHFKKDKISANNHLKALFRNDCENVWLKASERLQFHNEQS